MLREMATSEQFPYITDTEIKQFKVINVTNHDIKDLSEQRIKNAQRLTYNDETFPCFTQEEFEELKKQIHSLEDMVKLHQHKKENFHLTLKNTTITTRDMKGQPFSLVVFGLAQEGKSSVIKLLTDRNETKNDTDETLKEGNSQIREIIESKSFIFSSEMNERVLEEIRRIGKVLHEGHCVFLLVINSAIRRDVSRDKSVADLFQKFFGSEVLKYCVVVLTHASAGLQGESLDSHYQRVVGSGGLMAEIYKATYPNIVAVELSEVPTYLRSCYRQNIMEQIKKLMSYHQSLFQLDLSKLELRINGFSDSDEIMAPKVGLEGEYRTCAIL